MGSFGKRDNVLCPRCFSLERHRLLFEYLKDQTAILKQRVNLLHFAPEYSLGRIFRRHDNINYVTADLMTQHIPMFEIIPDHTMSVENILFDDNTFDFIICNHVLEHVHDDRKAMSELYRVLSPGGTAFLQVPINYGASEIEEDYSLNAEERAKAYGYQDHLRFYSEAGYCQRLRSAGFDVEVKDYVLGLDARKLALDKNERIFVCKK